MSKKKRRQKGQGGSAGWSSRKKVGPRYASRPNSPFFNSLISFFRRNWKVTRSILIFGGCILVFILAYSRITETAPMIALSTVIANATGLILNVLAFNTQVNGTSITSSHFAMTIADACTGIIPMAIIVSAVLAYPSSLKDKGKGIALGIGGLFVLNLARMVGLFMVGTWVPDFFDMAHYVVGQSLMILLAIAMWLFWEEKWVHGTAK